MSSLLPLGFTLQDHASDAMEVILKKLFSPEFRNRLDAIIHLKLARLSSRSRESSTSSSSSSRLSS